MDTVFDFMTTRIVTIDGDKTVRAAVARMKKNNIGSLLVKKGDKIVGIFTERDLLKRVDYANPQRLATTRIQDMMTRQLKKINYRQPYIKVIHLMAKNRIRHMPVVRNGRIVGIVSLRDLLVHYNEHLQQMLAEKEKELCQNIDTIRKSEERFRTIFHNSPLAITVVDKDERIVAWNPTLEQLLGFKKGQLRNRPVQDLYPPAEWKRIRAKKIRAIGEKHYFETKLIDKQGNLIDVEVSINVLKDRRGVAFASIGIMRDISEHKQLAELREKFIAVSHELRTPLVPIKEGISQVLDGLHGQTTAMQQKFLSAALSEVDRLKRTIDDLLEVFKFDAGKVVVQKQVVDIVRLVGDVVSTFSPEAAQKGLKLETAFSQETIHTYTDKDKLFEVFDNLVSNGLKFTAQGRIQIAVQVKGRDIYCRVSDTGRGIPKEHLPDLFTKFKQIGRMSGSAEGGTGLGLAICKEIVELLGGTIRVKSRCGAGTTFTFTIPHYIPRI